VGIGHGFVGERTDLTGLVHLRARQYAPSLGAFISSDSVQPNGRGTQGWNNYSYTSANPAARTDPSGHLVAEAAILNRTENKQSRGSQALLGGCTAGVLATGTLNAFTDNSQTRAISWAAIGGIVAAVSGTEALEATAGYLGCSLATYAILNLLQPGTPNHGTDQSPTNNPDCTTQAPQTEADDCGLPVFMPGGDTPETTAHIVDALSSNAGWSVLTRAEHPDSTSNRRWYQGDSRCAGEVGDALSCDEYPFYTSRQGGPGASLRLVPGWEQDKQGGFLSAFYGACGIGQGDDYVVAPMPSQPTTTFTC
jgi:RHS repeat-associated protein